MTEVISVKFKSCGKNYYFAPPAGKTISEGARVVVDTAKGLEIAECSRSNHMVEDTAVVQPLRPVVREVTENDLKMLAESKEREGEAFGLCLKKIEEHGLEMKLVSTECSFDGSKITFFFTSDGRVDFRELVKDLASVFHCRIELRQIGVRDEAKMLGGLGICGRPYCCSEFLDEFFPVSTKMAKVQNLSLNPTKISGSCGRLMCCLSYEHEAYEELTAGVPKQGAYVETPDGYGTAVLVNVMRQLVKVSLDSDPGDTTRTYKAKQVAAVPGGRPKDGEAPAHVLNYDPSTDTEEEITSPVTASDWSIPYAEVSLVEEGAAAEEESAEASESGEGSSEDGEAKKKKKRRHWYGKKGGKKGKKS